LSSESASRNGNDPRSARARVTLVLGYILAGAIPPFGLAIGLGLMFGRKSRSKHGRWIVLVSIIAGAIWWAIIKGGALSSLNQGY
jgi:hypothetical protein